MTEKLGQSGSSQHDPIRPGERPPATVFGVWEHDWEDDTLIGLYWTRKEAEAKAQSCERYGEPPWTVEEHVIPGPPPGEES